MIQVLRLVRNMRGTMSLVHHLAVRLILPVCPTYSTFVNDLVTRADDAVIALKNETMTLRERDTTAQLIGSVDEVIAVVDELVKGTLDWQGATSRLESYSGVQDVE